MYGSPLSLLTSPSTLATPSSPVPLTTPTLDFAALQKNPGKNTEFHFSAVMFRIGNKISHGININVQQGRVSQLCGIVLLQKKKSFKDAEVSSMCSIADTCLLV